MNKWKNGDTGKTVKETIENNFDKLEQDVADINYAYVKEFGGTSSALSWDDDGVITIEKELHTRDYPLVELYIKTENAYETVYGGYKIEGTTVKLMSDIPYEGKVVIR